MGLLLRDPVLLLLLLGVGVQEALSLAALLPELLPEPLPLPELLPELEAHREG